MLTLNVIESFYSPEVNFNCAITKDAGSSSYLSATFLQIVFVEFSAKLRVYLHIPNIWKDIM